MNNLEKIIKIIKANEKIIKADFKAKVLGIFGSYARDEAKSNSDIDLLVRFYNGATLFKLVELGEFLEEKLGIKVDIVSERALRSELKEQIFKEVIKI